MPVTALLPSVPLSSWLRYCLCLAVTRDQFYDFSENYNIPGFDRRLPALSCLLRRCASVALQSDRGERVSLALGDTCCRHLLWQHVLTALALGCTGYEDYVLACKSAKDVPVRAALKR